MTILIVVCMNHLSGKLINQDIITGDQCNICNIQCSTVYYIYKYIKICVYTNIIIDIYSIKLFNNS